MSLDLSSFDLDVLASFLRYRSKIVDLKPTPSIIWCCLPDPTFSRFGTVPACDDGGTDRVTDT